LLFILGYCRAEGIATVILESDRVSKVGYAKILASGCNSDGAKSKGEDEIGIFKFIENLQNSNSFKICDLQLILTSKNHPRHQKENAQNLKAK
jgi:hypothetical protein